MKYFTISSFMVIATATLFLFTSTSAGAAVPETLEVTVEEAISPLCFLGMDGSITVSVTGGTGQIMYGLDPENLTQNTPVFENLGAGTYTIYAADSGGCTGQSEEVLLEMPIPVTATIIQGDLQCNGDNSGFVEVFISGGTGDFTFSFQGGDFSPNDVWTGLAAGNYSIIAMDENGCLAYLDASLTQPAAIIVTDYAISEDSGQTDGSIEITVSGGAGGFTFSWTGPDGFTSDSEDIDGLVNGTYTVVITDETGCSITEDFVLEAPTTITDVAQDEFRIFPNPTNGVLNVSLEEGQYENSRVEVRDITGRLVAQQMLNSSAPNMLTLDLTDEPNGLYLLSVSNNHQTNTIRIIKR